MTNKRQISMKKIFCCAQGVNKIEKLFNLNHLQRLEKFEILTSLPLDLLNVVLESINDQLKTLAFKITLQDSGDLLPITRALLSKYQGLESLFITSDAWTDLFSFNEYPWKLKRLRVRTQVPDEESLKKLGEFIGLQQENIESLDLHLCFEKEPETFIEEVLDFFGLISRLKRLKTLKILLSIKGYKDGAQWYLHGLPNGESLINTLPISSSLIDMVNELKNLIILRLKCIGVDFSKDFERLFQALQQKSHVLEILEVNLGGYRIQKRDLEIMATTLLQFNPFSSEKKILRKNLL